MMRLSAPSLLFFATVATQILTSAYGMCSNGMPGVQSLGVCCMEECGTCGGMGCSQRPGGADACCMTEIREMGERCSARGEAPCMVDDEEMEPDTPVDTYSYDLESWDDGMPDRTTWCTGGVPGIESPKGDVCCPLGCGQCGGMGCSKFGAPELDSYDCCITEILDYGESCAATGEAPCYIEEDNY